MRILDLFCGAGGCSVGYARAGFDVVGVDHVQQPNYPFPFAHGDALRVLEQLVAGDALGMKRAPGAKTEWYALDDFDAIHASPPCQAYSALAHSPNVKEHPELVEPTRALLRLTGLPYVIENVPGAPLLDAVTICGRSMGMGIDGYQLRRHRLFESNVSLFVPPCACDHKQPTIGIYGDKARDRRRGRDLGRAFKREPASEAMGIDWMTWTELCQAIPPGYTELIGAQLLDHIRERTAA